MEAYGRDLAHVHDAGFGDFARGSARGLLRLLRRAGIQEGLVVDLGCGSGIWAAALLDAGYDVLGIDQSEALLEIARQRVPCALFTHGSLFDAELPPCAAVTAIGECVSYMVDSRAGRTALVALMRRVAAALQPGGLFVFDIVIPGREPAGGRRTWSEGADWLLCLHAHEDPDRRMLTREITIFRQLGDGYRRSDETHRLWLYSRADAVADLEAAGLQPRILSGYGQRVRFRRGHVGFAAFKPR
ncbi:MAG TPA: class I SAM-dependent methyltransferase [Solirubrobacteraceae bacterium]|jgi:SAM-dependent methyltransferase